jgi:hypothetical protein
MLTVISRESQVGKLHGHVFPLFVGGRLQVVVLQSSLFLTFLRSFSLFWLVQSNHRPLLGLVFSEMHEGFCLILCKVEEACFHDDVRILVIRKGPCGPLGFLVDLASDRPSNVCRGVVVRPGYDAILGDRKL